VYSESLLEGSRRGTVQYLGARPGIITVHLHSTVTQSAYCIQLAMATAVSLLFILAYLLSLSNG
jgi:hypothetical protein